LWRTAKETPFKKIYMTMLYIYIHIYTYM
jgi:hypothetical protein